MKIKTHRFVVDVRTINNRNAAYNDILCAFARRMPDGCEFFLRYKNKFPKKKGK